MACGPNQGPCPADIQRRLDELEEYKATLQQKLCCLTQVYCKMQKEFKKAKVERHHLEYHRTYRPPDADSKICPSPINPPPCVFLLRSNDIDRLCSEFRQLWPQLNQVLAEKNVRKVHNEKLKRKLRRLKEIYDPEDLVSIL